MRRAGARARERWTSKGRGEEGIENRKTKKKAKKHKNTKTYVDKKSIRK